MTCVRFAATMRGAPRNLAPTSLPLRQMTSQLASSPSTSMMSSKVSGMLSELSVRSRAPVAETSRTVQATVIWRSLEAATPAFKTRRRGAMRASSGVSLTSVLPIALNGTTVPPVLDKVVKGATRKLLPPPCPPELTSTSKEVRREGPFAGRGYRFVNRWEAAIRTRARATSRMSRSELWEREHALLMTSTGNVPLFVSRLARHLHQ
jgi:hypothetical protein